VDDILRPRGGMSLMWSISLSFGGQQLRLP